MSDIIVALILGVVEGLTEFLPISSTGHLILVGEFIGKTGAFANESFDKAFDIIIQFAAILSVILYFWDKLWPFSAKKTVNERNDSFSVWFKAIAGVVPALILGFLLDDWIEEHFFNPMTVSIALIGWGVVLIILESRQRRGKIQDLSALTLQMVLLIGLIQCIAMIPGTSRSAATIIGAMLLGCSRLVAAEFSFFLAIPTMTAAAGYSLLKLMKSGIVLTNHDWLVLGIGFVTSFLVAYAVIAFFMRYITQNDFRPFGWYRIALGLLVLGYFSFIV